MTPKYWIPFEVGARACPGRNFAMDLLLTLGLKIVTELELSFDGFVDKEASDENELRERILLKIFGLSFGLKNSLRFHFDSGTCLRCHILSF